VTLSHLGHSAGTEVPNRVQTPGSAPAWVGDGFHLAAWFDKFHLECPSSLSVVP
jgi:hypothetical protein